MFPRKLRDAAAKRFVPGVVLNDGSATIRFGAVRCPGAQVLGMRRDGGVPKSRPRSRHGRQAIVGTSWGLNCV